MTHRAKRVDLGTPPPGGGSRYYNFCESISENSGKLKTSERLMTALQIILIAAALVVLEAVIRYPTSP